MTVRDGGAVTAAQRRRQRRLWSHWRHAQLSVRRAFRVSVSSQLDRAKAVIGAAVQVGACNFASEVPSAVVDAEGDRCCVGPLGHGDICRSCGGVPTGNTWLQRRRNYCVF